MTMAKFFVHAGGRWCEVDVADGSVSGWRENARFVYCRRGRLEVARSWAVLRGLRALQVGSPTTVRDGPRLSQLRRVNKELSARRSQLTHTHCCSHALMCNNNSDCIAHKYLKKKLTKRHVDTAKHAKVDVSTQVQANVQVETVRTTLSLSHLKSAAESKREREDSSDNTFEVTKLKAGSKLRLTKVKTPQTISKSDKIENVADPSGQKKELRSKEDKNGDSSDDLFEIEQPKKKVKLTLVKRPGLAKRKRSGNSNSDATTESDTGTQTSKYTSVKPKLPTSKRTVNLSLSSDSDLEISKLNTRNRSLKRSPTKLKLMTLKQRFSVNSSSNSNVEMTKLETRNISSKNTPSKLKLATSKKKISILHSSDSDVDTTKPKTRNRTLKSPMKLQTISTNSENRSDTTKQKHENRPRNRNANPKVISKPKASVSCDSDSTVIITRKDADKQKSGMTKRGNSDILSAEPSDSEKRAMQMSSWLAKSSQKRAEIQHGELCKELLIDESDVQVMRRFLIKYAMDIDIEAFDSDDDYKRMVFYRINPLVSVERCQTIADMYRRQASPTVTLQHFVSNLGLRSINEVAKQSSHYKTRSKIVNDRRPSSDTDKENFKNSSGSSKKNSDNSRNFKSVQNGGVQKEAGLRRVLNNKVKRVRVGKDGSKASTVSGDSGREEAIVSKPTSHEQVSNVPSKGPKIRHVISKRSSCPTREYSNLEDHAIVSWVSVGGRAGRVNGNQVWLELQSSYSRLTGVTRSWHSLRNRYLRYILPSLPALHLPAEHVARLRAAASTGSIKSKKRPPRRNSIFNKEAGVKGAWCRRPRSPEPPDTTAAPHLDKSESDQNKSDGESPSRRALRSSLRHSRDPVAGPSQGPGAHGLRPRTPRYSDLTRQFSRRHRLSQHSDSDSGSSSAPLAPAPPRGHRKKLFNPKKVPT